MTYQGNKWLELELKPGFTTISGGEITTTTTTIITQC